MIRAIIVDDEQPSVEKLKKILHESGMVEIKGEFTQPLEAVEFVKANKVDAAFLDIEMPDLDGIELSNYLIDHQSQLAIIFVTAYNQYAVEAFRLNALDYLMKPVSAERLQETLNRIITEKAIPIQRTPLRIRCFGKFTVDTGNMEVKFRTEKARELLAFLVEQRGNFVHRGDICDYLWEDYDGDRAVIHFHTTLHYVKKALLQYGVEIPIEHDKGNYRLNMEGLDCDYWYFQRFGATGKVNQANINQYEEAAKLYEGDYLAGEEYTWAERNRQMLKERFIKLMLEIAAYYQAAGELQINLDRLKQGLIQEPLHRELNYRLIETLLLANDKVSADKYYDIYRNELGRRLRQEPDESFRKLLGKL